jgi:hypothetical protein
MKVRTYSLMLFSKRTPPAKSLSCLEFGDVVITRRLILLCMSILSLAVKLLLQVLLTGWMTTSDGITDGLL